MFQFCRFSSAQHQLDPVLSLSKCWKPAFHKFYSFFWLMCDTSELCKFHNFQSFSTSLYPIIPCIYMKWWETMMHGMEIVGKVTHACHGNSRKIYLPTLMWVSHLRVENFDLTPAHTCGPNSHAWLINVRCCSLVLHNFRKYVNSDRCKKWKLCVKWWYFPRNLWFLKWKVLRARSHLYTS